MIEKGSRLRQMSWLAALALCLAAFAALSFKVQSVESEVRLAERQIVALKQETTLLETEFQTRASQRQLSEWNKIEFGYEFPRADQYINSQKQLASLGQGLRADAPNPVRLVRADLNLDSADAPRKMVSPLSGQAVTLASLDTQTSPGGIISDTFSDFLIDASPIRAAQARTPDNTALAVVPVEAAAQ